LQAWLPEEVMLKLGAILPPRIDQRNNFGVCAGARHGDYSVAHGYNMMCNLVLTMMIRVG
ncbi:hypothetical protein A2U01_0074868, partial [Trifolium medium]|nr:hypothetical protein [Trifolium medium]